MPATVKYQSEIKTVPFGDKTITIENLTPILPPKERERRRREIEKRLRCVQQVRRQTAGIARHPCCMGPTEL